jgi:hypothetical protein
MGRSSEFEYHPSLAAAAQVDAAIAATAPRRQVGRYGLEIAIVGLLLLVAAAAAGPAFFSHGVVAARRIAAGSAISPGDLRVVAMPLDPPFTTIHALQGCIATREIAPGEPLRRDTVSRLRAVAHETLQRGAIIAPAVLDFTPGPWIEDGFADLSLAGRRTTAVIAKGAVLRASLVEPRAAARVALRDIAPFELLTAKDIAGVAPLTLAVEPIHKGAIVQPTDLAAIEPQFDTLMAVKLANSVARTTPGAVATLVALAAPKAGQAGGADPLRVQILRVTRSGDGANAIIALRAKDRKGIAAAAELRAFEEVHSDGDRSRHTDRRR